jgi:dihydrodipicolinate synthase/N-acetylneuraminate lyase
MQEVTMEFSVGGVVPAMVTPLRDEGRQVDYDVLGDYCEFLVERGVSGLFPLGTTGEGPLLSAEERKQVLEHVVEYAAGRAAVIANCGDITTQTSIALMQHAARAGADAASVVYPYYYRLGLQDVMAHFEAVASAVPDFPVYLYYYRQGLEPQQTLRLKSKSPNIVGMKEGQGDYKSMLGHIEVMGQRFSVLEGSEMLAYGALTLGADGLISGVAAAVPEPFVELYRLIQDQRYAEARAVQSTIYGLAQVFYGRNPWAFIKKGLALRGIPAGPCRAPVGECTTEETEYLRSGLVELGFL